MPLLAPRHHLLRPSFSLLARHPRPHHHHPPSQRPLSFRTSPSPPRLPEEDQHTFETLQKSAFARHPDGEPPAATSSPSSSASSSSAAYDSAAATAATTSTASTSSTQSATSGLDESRHRDLRRGARPEFDGEVNPATGEVGGPKSEPLRWGAGGDWSYAGRVTDF